MSGMNYERMARIARRLIEENGVSVTLERKDGDSVTRINAKGVRDTYDESIIDNKLIFGTDIKLLLDARAEPKAADRVFIDSAFAGTVLNVTRIAPGPTDVMYEAHVRV